MASITMGWTNSWYVPKKYTSVRNLVYNNQSKTVLGVVSGNNGQINHINISNGGGSSSGGGSSEQPTIIDGTKNYPELNNKPSINGVTLNGNKTTADLKLDYKALINQPNIASSYNDLTDKPKINGTELKGNVTLDLGIKKYNDATDKPSINGVTLSGNKTSAELGINIPDKVSALTNDVNYVTEAQIDSKLANYTEVTKLATFLKDYYNKSQIDAKLSSVFTYKGTIASIDDLNAITNPSVGDVYRVGTNDKYEFYARTETKWDNWGSSFVDLSNYVQFTDLASDTKAGLMSTDDKKKLDGIADKAEVNKIDSVSVNGTAVNPDAAKNVDIKVPIQSIEVNSTAVNPDATGKVSITTPDVPVKQVKVDGTALTPDSTGAVNVVTPTIPIKKITMNDTEIKPDADGTVALQSGSTTYTGSASIDVGGITAGRKFTDTPISEVIDAIINPYQKPVIAISISPNTATYEKGVTTNSITVTARITKKSKDIKSLTFSVNGQAKSTITDGVANGGSFTYTAGTFTTDTTFKVEASDEDNTVSASTAIKFTDASYYGIVDVAPANVSASIITGLTKRVSTSKNFTYNGITMTNKRIVYAIPTSLGTVASIVDGNGYQVKGSYTQTNVTINSIAYYVYTLTDTATLNGGKMIFS